MDPVLDNAGRDNVTVTVVSVHALGGVIDAASVEIAGVELDGFLPVYLGIAMTLPYGSMW